MARGDFVKKCICDLEWARCKLSDEEMVKDINVEVCLYNILLNAELLLEDMDVRLKSYERKEKLRLEFEQQLEKEKKKAKFVTDLETASEKTKKLAFS